jgi:histidyl-tRNA synthetase
MQPVWRADKPQRGRFREFTQCDADITGCASLMADAEVLSAAGTALGRLGFTDVVLRLNHRDTLFGLIEAAGIPAALETSSLIALDKLDKIGWDGVLEELGARGVEPAQAAWLRETLETARGSNDEVLGVLGQRLDASERGRRGVGQTRELLGLTEATPARALLRVDPCLARGLSYYTGPIFEATSPRLAGSIAGGGRYDRLIGMFAGQDIPAVGFTLGLDRLEVVMEELELFPKHLERAVDVLVAWMDTPAESLALAVELRGAGLKVEVYPEKEKLGKQLQYAELRNIRAVALMGRDEVKRGEVAVKDLVARTQQSLARDQVVASLLGGLSA